MSRARFEDLYALHALDALDAPEREAFEAHLATECPECREGLAQARSLLPALALSAPAAEPPPALRERILGRVRAGTGAPPARPEGRRLRRLLPLALAASLAALAVAGTGYLRARDAERERSRIVALLADPATPRATLKRQETPVGTAVFDGDRREILLFAGGLGGPPAGKTFVLWILPKGGGAPRNAGALRAPGRGGPDAVVRDAGPLDPIAGVAVSEESDPATPTPTRVVGVALF